MTDLDEDIKLGLSDGLNLLLTLEAVRKLTHRAVKKSPRRRHGSRVGTHTPRLQRTRTSFGHVTWRCGRRVVRLFLGRPTFGCALVLTRTTEVDVIMHRLKECVEVVLGIRSHGRRR
jgi:hypothetical protein